MSALPFAAVVLAEACDLASSASSCEQDDLHLFLGALIGVCFGASLSTELIRRIFQHLHESKIASRLKIYTYHLATRNNPDKSDDPVGMGDIQEDVTRLMEIEITEETPKDVIDAFETLKKLPSKISAYERLLKDSLNSDKSKLTTTLLIAMSLIIGSYCLLDVWCHKHPLHHHEWMLAIPPVLLVLLAVLVTIICTVYILAFDYLILLKHSQHIRTLVRYRVEQFIKTKLTDHTVPNSEQSFSRYSDSGSRVCTNGITITGPQMAKVLEPAPERLTVCLGCITDQYVHVKRHTKLDDKDGDSPRYYPSRAIPHINSGCISWHRSDACCFEVPDVCAMRFFRFNDSKKIKLLRKNRWRKWRSEKA